MMSLTSTFVATTVAKRANAAGKKILREIKRLDKQFRGFQIPYRCDIRKKQEYFPLLNAMT